MTIIVYGEASLKKRKHVEQIPEGGRGWKKNNFNCEFQKPRWGRFLSRSKPNEECLKKNCSNLGLENANFLQKVSFYLFFDRFFYFLP